MGPTYSSDVRPHFIRYIMTRVSYGGSPFADESPIVPVSERVLGGSANKASVDLSSPLTSSEHHGFLEKLSLGASNVRSIRYKPNCLFGQ